MKVSAKSEYGVRAMVQLARAYGKGPVPLSYVAEAEHISQDFLEQLMLVLRQKGLVRSTRGAHGGYVLTMDPTEISVGDVMSAVEGPFVPMQCLEFAGENQETCCMGIIKPGCSTRDVWVLLQEKVNETLNSVTLADLSRDEGEPLRFSLVGNTAPVARVVGA